MKIGVPKEIKNREYRVGLTPAAVHELCGHKHKVLVETGAGVTIGFSDEDYRQAGAHIVESPREVFELAELIAGHNLVAADIQKLCQNPVSNDRCN